jgi:hypothetical protein
MIRQLIEGKDQEIASLKASNQDLVDQNEKLTQMVEEEWKDRQKRKVVTDE